MGTVSVGPWTAPSRQRLLVQPDGDIVLVGIEQDGGDSSADDLVAARFLPNGQPDDSFGTEGIAICDLGQSANSCDAVIQPGNQIVAAAGLGDGTVELLRFTTIGGLDAGFGSNSSGMVNIPSLTGNPLLAVQPDGRIDLAGGNASGGFALLQYLADGSGTRSDFRRRHRDRRLRRHGPGGSAQRPHPRGRGRFGDGVLGLDRHQQRRHP